eukprot:scaffold1459_cov260-Pinguiococcus_pyrenoidosus.AAC.4
MPRKEVKGSSHTATDTQRLQHLGSEGRRSLEETDRRMVALAFLGRGLMHTFGIVPAQWHTLRERRATTQG